jgi:succinate dehydrogenase hydrophobic anchor subunit
VAEDPAVRSAVNRRAPVLRRGWADRDAWRGTRAGLWAWLLQRAAAVALVVVIVLHLRNPFIRSVQAILLVLVLLHGLLGLRAILLDVGVPVRLHRALFVAALALGVALFVGFWSWRWY